ncbi:MAG: hypothetical protein IK062_00340 [Selenomonadaceae bacterium]|nr:hypothetical protein [Selenomonadaceae bacterium]
MKIFDSKLNCLVILMLMTVSMTLAGCGNLGKFPPNVQVVREGSFNINKSVKIGVAFDQFFKNGQWRYFRSTNNERIVEFTGEFMLSEHPDLMLMQFYTGNFNALNKNSDKVPAKTVIQFILEGETFNIRHMEINGVTMDNLTILAMVEKIVSSYRAVPAK